MSGYADKTAGKAKEITGRAIGDKELEGKGKTQHAAGKVKETVGHAAAKVEDGVDAVKDKLTRK